MRILDSRRLTGPNMMSPRKGCVAEIAFDPGEDPARAIAAFRAQLTELADAAPLELDGVYAREFRGGAALGFDAPIDLLLASSDLNDLAIARATSALAGETLPPVEEALRPIREAIASEAKPRLRDLEEEAEVNDLPLLADDAEISLGMGAHSRTWPLAGLPSVEEVPWSELRRIPVALITGTNGKTTSARLLAHLLAQSGKRVGLAATDFVSIAGEIVERGDFTGPAAARLVLRDRRVEVAVLETARGGILRRGLAFDRADCALITNIADDHLGEYGIDDVEALARVKGVVARAVPATGVIALNADDPESVSLWRRAPEMFHAPISWFSTAPESGLAASILQPHLQAGGEAFLLENGALVHRQGESRQELLRASEIPIAFGGAASFNVANALGVAALALALGLSREQVVLGLRSFRPDAKDNPGRSNLFAGPDGVRVLIDFAHNAHGVDRLAGLVAGLRGSHPLSTIAACAGDRSDENLRELCEAISAMGPRRVLLRDLPDYLRGRAPGEVPEKMSALLEELGMITGAVEIRAGEADALEHALATAESAELVLVLVHLEEDEVAALLEKKGFRPA